MQSIALTHHFPVSPDVLVSVLDKTDIWESMHHHIATIERCEPHNLKSHAQGRSKTVRFYPRYQQFPRPIARYLSTRVPYQDTHFVLDRITMTETIRTMTSIGMAEGETRYLRKETGECERQIRIAFTASTPVLKSAIEKFFARRTAHIYDTEADLLRAWIEQHL